MIFRQARPEEILSLFEEGYKEWPKNRTFQQYCMDNGKEDSYGTRYVLEVGGNIVSSLIVLDVKSFNGRNTYGFGSVLTPGEYAGNGYATQLLKKCIELISDTSPLFLYSDITPSFYERLNFRILPDYLQKRLGKSVCMVLCEEDVWTEILSSSIEQMPDYF